MREEFGERGRRAGRGADRRRIDRALPRAQGGAPRTGAGRRHGAHAIYGADKLTNVAALRQAYEAEGHAVREEFRVPIELKTEVWEADLELLREKAPLLPFLDELDDELSLFRARLEAPAPPRA